MGTPQTWQQRAGEGQGGRYPRGMMRRAGSARVAHSKARFAAPACSCCRGSVLEAPAAPRDVFPVPCQKGSPIPITTPVILAALCLQALCFSSCKISRLGNDSAAGRGLWGGSHVAVPLQDRKGSGDQVEQRQVLTPPPQLLPSPFFLESRKNTQRD